MLSRTSQTRTSSPEYSTTSKTETRLATHHGAPCPTGNPTTCSPNDETSATTADSAQRNSTPSLPPDRLCENNQRNRQKIGPSNPFDTHSTTLIQTAIAGSSVTYDANGNRLTDQAGARSFVYNNRNRMSTVSDGSGSLATYSYNALGQRVNKVAGSDDIAFVYNQQGQLLGEYANGSYLREYVYSALAPVAQLESTQTIYLHPDHLGTPREASNSNANVVWRWDGDPFGKAIPTEDPDGDSRPTKIYLRFPGQYADLETDLNYNYFRNYQAVQTALAGCD